MQSLMLANGSIRGPISSAGTTTVRELENNVIDRADWKKMVVDEGSRREGIYQT